LATKDDELVFIFPLFEALVDLVPP